MSFRKWMSALRQVRGNQPHWPCLLGTVLEDEFQRQRNVGDGYSREVFLDRDDHEHEEGNTERRMVAGLYHACCQQTQGCLAISDETIWLLGYEWPNQGGNDEKGRRADLVGLMPDGGLVVFECKRSDNADPPLTAVLEGLDYLACLLREANFTKIVARFEKWKTKPGKPIPAGFEKSAPRIDARPAVIVLAPGEYFHGRYRRSKRGEGWWDVAEIGNEVAPSFRIGFACSDFTGPEATWA